MNLDIQNHIAGHDGIFDFIFGIITSATQPISLKFICFGISKFYLFYLFRFIIRP